MLLMFLVNNDFFVNLILKIKKIKSKIKHGGQWRFTCLFVLNFELISKHKPVLKLVKTWKERVRMTKFPPRVRYHPRKLNISIFYRAHRAISRQKILNSAVESHRECKHLRSRHSEQTCSRGNQSQLILIVSFNAFSAMSSLNEFA